MKTISLLIAFCFSFNVLAGSGSISALENAFDQYQYVMTVEWDQKDKVFQETQTADFIKSVKEIIKSEGLGKNEVMGFVEKRIQDKKALEALKVKLSHMSSEEMMKAIQDSSKDFYSRGASWTDVGTYTLLTIIVIAMVISGLSAATYEDDTYDSLCSDGNEYCY